MMLASGIRAAVIAFGLLAVCAHRTSAQRAVLTGVVIDSAGGPVVGAEVLIPSLSRVVRTGDAGRFHIRDIPAGTHEVHVRSVGRSPVVVELKFFALDSVDRRFELRRLTVLDTSRTIGVGNWRRTFDERRRVGLGKFVTAEDIERQKPAQTSQLLHGLTGLRIQRSRLGGKMIAYSRTGFSSLSGVSCGQGRYADVYVDGVLIYRWTSIRPPDPVDAFDVNGIDPGRIAAIEYYARASQTPVEYQNLDSTCGVLVIWTKK